MAKLCKPKNTFPTRRKYFLAFFLVVFVLSLVGGFFLTKKEARAQLGISCELEGNCVVCINLDTMEEVSRDCYSSEAEAKVALAQANKGLAAAIGGYFYEQLLRAFAWLCDLILYLFSWLVALGGILLDLSFAITDKLHFTKSQIVQAGWPIVRDIANMFFALILLVIAFATILRIETYGMKNVLFKLVIAALLINFSLVIGGTIVDFSNVLTRYLAQGHYQLQTGENVSISTAILNNLQTTSFWKMDPAVGNKLQGKVGSTGFMALVINTIMGSFLMIITAFVLLAAAVLFLVRMVALWILLIFAPLAWIAMILPATTTLWNRWWNEFLKWCIFAPVYAFFIYLTVFAMSKNILLGNPEIQSIANSSQSVWEGAKGTVYNTFFQSVQIIVNYIVLIIFLIAGLVFARSAGIYGASGLYKGATALIRGSGRMASRWTARGARIPGADTLSRWIGPQRLEKWGFKKTAAVLRAPAAVKRFIAPAASPHMWTKTWAIIKQRADEKAFNVPAAQIAGMYESLLSAGRFGAEYKKAKGEATKEGLPPGDAVVEATGRAGWRALKNIFGEQRLAQIEYQKIVARRQKEIADATKDEDQLVHIANTATDKYEREAAQRIVGSINAINTQFKQLAKEMDPDKVREFLETLEGFTEDERARMAADISAMAAANGNYSLVGMTKWDPEKNKIVFASAKEQKTTAVNKAMQMEFQKWATTIHPDSFFARDAQGDITDFHEVGKEMLHNITGGHIAQVGRLQGRTLKALSEKYQKMIDEAEKVGGAQGERIREFAEKIKARYETGERL